MTSALRIQSVPLKPDPWRDAFVQFPWQLRASDPGWIPPERDRLHRRFDRERNLFFGHGDAALFVCLEGDQVRGRISASYDKSLFAGDPRIGHFGHFECADDPRVAHALLSAAEQWLLGHGRTQVFGPVDFNIFCGYRVQLSGFDTAPFVGEPRSPRYYARLLVEEGYQFSPPWRSWDIHRGVFPLALAQARGHARALDDGRLGRLRYHSFSPETAAEDWQRAFPLILGAFQNNFHCPEVGAREFAQLAPSPALTDPGCFLVSDEERPVGFAWGHAARVGDPENRTAVFNTFAVLPEYRQSGLANRILERAFQYLMDVQADWVIGALAKPGRTTYDMFGSPSRSYGVCSKSLH